MRIFISAGEPSGDLHAANLIRSLRKLFPDAEFTGFGGAQMTEAGARLLYPLVNLAVMWFLNVFLNLVTFVRLIFRADRHFRDRTARRGRAGRLPGPALVDRQASEGARNPGHLFRSTSDLGLGRLAHQEGQEVRRPRPVQPSVRAGSGTAIAGSRTPSTSDTLTSMSSRTGRSMRTSWRTNARVPASWFRFCPARGLRRWCETFRR